MLKKTKTPEFALNVQPQIPAESSDEIPAKPHTEPDQRTKTVTTEPETTEAESAKPETDQPETTESEIAETVATPAEATAPTEPVITGRWGIDPSHTRIGFSTRHAMISRIRGAFNEVSGGADIAENIADSSATVVMQTASIDTRNVGRDQHLCSEDFFNVEEFPEIRFTSTAIDEVDDNSYVVTGELTIKDVTKSVSIPLELLGIDSDPFGNLRAGLEGTRRIDRRDWAMQWNTPLDSGGVLVGEKITLEFELSLIKEFNRTEAAPESADD